LPNDVVEANTVNAFKYRLDKRWSNQDVLFDFNADLIGTGSVPISFACDRTLQVVQKSGLPIYFCYNFVNS